jgi:hypothetical protein
MPHFTSLYASSSHPWTLTQPASPAQNANSNAARSFSRPLGLVESSFDTDGSYFSGRADMTATLTLALSHTLSTAALRYRVAAAWTLLRLRHVMLMSRVVSSADGSRRFLVDVPASVADALAGDGGVRWFSDLGLDAVETEDVHHHALNAARIIQPAACMSRCHVLPLRATGTGTYELRFLIVMAHQISDGLSAYSWFRDFLRILNDPLATILADIKDAICVGNIQKRLPPAQEDLYPKVKGSEARQRWFWAIMRVLRHVQRTMPPTFTNPLRRETRLEGGLVLPRTYPGVFDYSDAARPGMASGHVVASLSPAASAHMIALCREAQVSIGAGCFALVGMSMMDMHAARSSSTPAFGASFPLNPRAFFGTKVEADSCMLAFSEGILMPFLPATLPVEKRFKLVAKHANRELRVYQKRLKDGSQQLGSFDRHSPERLLATGYLSQIERVDAKLPAERRTGLSPQGELKPRIGQYGATCGVSSVGSLKAYFRPGEYDLKNLEEKDFAADYRGLKMGVRARENEFLIGSSTDANGIVGFGVSYNMNAISQEVAQKWAETVSGLLERDGPRL